jgi:hypothetical protein
LRILHVAGDNQSPLPILPDLLNHYAGVFVDMQTFNWGTTEIEIAIGLSIAGNLQSRDLFVGES